MIWYRVFYRTGKSEAVLGEAALQQRLGRKAPAVMHHEVAIIHRCMQCEQEGPWTPSWMSYVELANHPDHVRERAQDGKYIACSPHWANIYDEPNRDPARNTAWLTAIWAEDERKRETVAHRKVPMVEWKGQGFCKWCNGKMTPADKPSTMWHRGCAQQWKLHSLLDVQTKFCRERDGRGCASEAHAEGCPGVGSELDHRVPLWKVRHLPLEERRPYYGPDNIWLLSWVCHAAKTKREAAERAALKRAGPDEGTLL
jgi:hypothetical protein